MTNVTIFGWTIPTTIPCCFHCTLSQSISLWGATEFVSQIKRKCSDLAFMQQFSELLIMNNTHYMNQTISNIQKALFTQLPIIQSMRSPYIYWAISKTQLFSLCFSLCFSITVRNVRNPDTRDAQNIIAKSIMVDSKSPTW